MNKYIKKCPLIVFDSAAVLPLVIASGNHIPGIPCRTDLRNIQAFYGGVASANVVMPATQQTRRKKRIERPRSLWSAECELGGSGRMRRPGRPSRVGG